MELLVQTENATEEVLRKIGNAVQIAMDQGNVEALASELKAFEGRMKELCEFLHDENEELCKIAATRV